MEVQEFLNTVPTVYGPLDIILNLALACGLGLVISSVYKVTHRGLSYSQSFMLTVVFVTVVVAMVMMVIGNNLARAFALVGALSIIRFRTVIKDTKDTVFIFLSLAAGMACGTSSYFLGVVGTLIVSAFAILLHVTNYGSIYKSEIIVRFRAKDGMSSKYSVIFQKYALSKTLIDIEPSGDKHETSLITFDLILKKNVDADDLARDLSQLDGLTEIKLIASKTDVDY